MTPHKMDAQRLTGVRVLLKLIGTLLALYLVHEAWLDREVHQDETLRLERHLDDSQRKIASHDDFAAQLQEERGLLSSSIQRLPSKLASPAIEKTLREQAAQAGIRITSMRMGAETVKEGFYAERGVYLVLHASAADFVTFMAGLLRELPLRRVTAIKIEPADNPGTVRVTMTAFYYRYIDDMD